MLDKVRVPIANSKRNTFSSFTCVYLAFPKAHNLAIYPAALPLSRLDNDSFSGEVNNAVGRTCVSSDHGCGNLRTQSYGNSIAWR